MEKKKELSEILFKAIQSASDQAHYDAIVSLSQEWRALNGLSCVPYSNPTRLRATGGV